MTNKNGTKKCIRPIEQGLIIIILLINITIILRKQDLKKMNKITKDEVFGSGDEIWTLGW